MQPAYLGAKINPSRRDRRIPESANLAASRAALLGNLSDPFRRDNLRRTLCSLGRPPDQEGPGENGELCARY